MLDKNKMVFIIVFLLIVALVGYFWITNPKLFSSHVDRDPITGVQLPPPAPMQQNPNASLPMQNTVIYGSAGFSPNTLTIRKGATITFQNNSTRDMRPASDPHPVHTDYPTKGGCVGSTFDSCRTIKPGSYWSFEFDIVGTWKYHNHLNPSDTGTIIVVQ